MTNMEQPDTEPLEDAGVEASIIDLSPKRQVGDRVFVSIPGDVPRVYVKRPKEESEDS